MTALARKPLPEAHFQAFRGGNKKLSQRTEALLRGTCCDAGMSIVFDRLPQRMRFDNGLGHENPKGANQKWDFGHEPDKTKLVKHMNDYQADTVIGVIAPPSYALVTHIAVSLGELPAGFTFHLSSRNGFLENVTGTLHTVTISGNTCEPTRDYTSADSTALSSVKFAQLQAGELRKDYILVLDKPAFVPQADELTIEIDDFATSKRVSEADFNLVVAVNYDFAIRSEY